MLLAGRKHGTATAAITQETLALGIPPRHHLWPCSWCHVPTYTSQAFEWGGEVQLVK